MMKNPPHPGEIIGEDVIGEVGLTVAEAAARSACPASRSAVSSMATRA